jgi:hypothetical protein
MAVQQEIKSQLAKLLATEDLVVEHKDVPTAQFNVHTRELLLPMWEKASNHVYDMLVGHEVGHALFTPDEEMGVEVPATFLNVVEDVRIEKLMKRKYLGIAKTFYRGYHELHEKDFFEVKDENIDDLNLADRVNLYYKVGTFLDVPFTDAETKIVELIGKCETFKEVKEAARILYEYCKDEVNDQQSQKKAEDAGDGEMELPSNSSEPETEEVDGQEVDDETPDAEPTPAEAEKEPEVQTAESLESHLQDLVRENAVENVYLEVPDLNLDSIIATNEDIHKEIDRSWKQQQDFIDDCTSKKSNLFEEVDVEYNQFKRDAQKEVSYLVKEFECKKAASAYSRAATSRTGVLDTARLHTYKFNEDLFKKVTVLPDGKNHGLVFVLDWSGSMSREMLDTVKQLYNLIWFCKKVSIPFDVYAFTNEWKRREQDATGQWNPVTNELPYEPQEYNLQVEEDFSLMNLFTSNVRTNELEHQLKNIWRIASVFSNYYGSKYSYPTRLCLSGTPLNESLICLHKLLPKFQKENNVEKVQCIVLTDGEANTMPYHVMVKDYFNSDEYKMGVRGINASQCSLRDRSLGKTYKFGYSWWNFTEVLIKNLQDKFPSSNFIGIRVLPVREGSNIIRRYCDDPADYEKCLKDWRKLKTFTIKSSGYDAYFGLSSSALADETEFEVKDGATKGQIKTAFVKSLKTKKLNKKVLGEFVSLVA